MTEPKQPARIPRVAPEDKPIYENPWDTSPRTEQEAYEQSRIQQQFERVTKRLQKSRHWITLAQLSQMVGAHPRYEGGIPERGLFAFTVSGQVGLQKVEGALLGGSLMIISAAGPAEAAAKAQEGLNDTIAHMNRYVFAQQMGVDLENPMDPANGVSVVSEPVH